MAKEALITGITGQDGAYLAEFLLGDPTKAKKLGWIAKITFDELVTEKVREDYKSPQCDELLKKHRYQAMDYHK